MSQRQHKPTGWWCRLRLALYALSAGAALTPSCAAYGPSVPFPPESGLEIVSLEYAPASPIHIGDRLLFQATTNRASQLAAVEVQFWLSAGKIKHLQLHDDGVAPDEIGGDGVWTAETLWYKAWGTRSNLSISSRLVWDNGAINDGAVAPPLTVLPLQKEQR